jgi:hypothetical protein
MDRGRKGYQVMLIFVTCLFNVFYDNVLILQLKYALNCQQMTEVEPVLRSQITAQATSSPAVVQPK